jgi:hypothetical protein
VAATVDTVKSDVKEVTLLVRAPLRVPKIAVGPFVLTGVTALDRVTVPIPLRTLLTVTSDVFEEPAAIVRFPLVADSAKDARLIAIPVWAVSWLGVAPPFVIVTQTPGTLEPLGHVPEVVAEVRKLTGVPLVAVTT